jgi:hypothetical protein
MKERPIFIPKVSVFFSNILTGGIAGVFFYIMELDTLALVYEATSNILAFTFTKV